MTTVAELIDQLRELPPNMPVHVWTHEEEFEDLVVYEREADPEFGYATARVAIEGR